MSQKQIRSEKISVAVNRVVERVEDSGCESDVFEFLYALVRLLKPVRALEMGIRRGSSTVAIATALRDNGFGKLISVGCEPGTVECPSAQVTGAGLNNWVEYFADFLLGPPAKFAGR